MRSPGIQASSSRVPASAASAATRTGIRGTPTDCLIGMRTSLAIAGGATTGSPFE
jgi:hypothetical protein